MRESDNGGAHRMNNQEAKGRNARVHQVATRRKGRKFGEIEEETRRT